MTEKDRPEDEALDKMVEHGYEPNEAADFLSSLLATVKLATSKPVDEIPPQEWAAAQATKQ